MLITLKTADVSWPRAGCRAQSGALYRPGPGSLCGDSVGQAPCHRHPVSEDVTAWKGVARSLRDPRGSVRSVCVSPGARGPSIHTRTPCPHGSLTEKCLWLMEAVVTWPRGRMWHTGGRTHALLDTFSLALLGSGPATRGTGPMSLVSERRCGRRCGRVGQSSKCGPSGA